MLCEKGTEGVAEVTLNRPERLNALDSGAKRRLAEVWADLDRDERVRAVVLKGAGRAFCAGSDIIEIAESGQAVSTEVLLAALPGAVVPMRKPVVAALHGYAVGMGLTLALHTDIRLCAPDTVLRFPEVQHGMISAVSAVILPRVAGPSRAAEMLLTGETVSPAAALQAGLVTRVVDDVHREATRVAAAIAAFPPRAVQITARLTRAAVSADLAAHKEMIEAARAELAATSEPTAGAQAFEAMR